MSHGQVLGAGLTPGTPVQAERGLTKPGFTLAQGAGPDRLSVCVVPGGGSALQTIVAPAPVHQTGGRHDWEKEDSCVFASRYLDFWTWILNTL